MGKVLLFVIIIFKGIIKVLGLVPFLLGLCEVRIVMDIKSLPAPAAHSISSY
jgi:hypothetical protein